MGFYRGNGVRADCGGHRQRNGGPDQQMEKERKKPLTGDAAGGCPDGQERNYI